MSKSTQQKRAAHNYRGVIGIDEVGRGPLAGPVTVCAVFVENTDSIKKELFGGKIKDSKKLTKEKRNNIYSLVVKGELKTKVVYAVSSRTAAHVDRYGISLSIRKCIESCMNSLLKQGVNIMDSEIRLDAGLVVPGEGFTQKSFVKGDERFSEIALASIIAKVRRDAHMEILSRKHQEYCWADNAGYGTLKHRQAIAKYGTTRYHRVTYLKNFA